jgi:type IV pilus assembly protein PilB
MTITDEKLFKELVRQKILDAATAERLLKDAELSGGSAEELLYGRRLADEVAVAKIKSVLTKAPYKKVDASAVPAELLKLIPYETSRHYQMVPISRDGHTLLVGMLHPDDREAQDALKFVAKREQFNVGVYVATPSDLETVWRRYVPFQSEIDAAVRQASEEGEDGFDLVSLEEGSEDANAAPIIRIVSSTVTHAVESGASDIHIEPQRSRLRVRFRINGELGEVASLPPALSRSIVARVKVLSSLKLDETRRPQDGRFRTMVRGKDVDFRVATFPTPAGEKAVIRVLDPTTGLKGLAELGLSEHNLSLVGEALARPYGMVLITGPTGSGKTTTLYAMLQQLNTETVNVMSLEDPVEYFVEGMNQSQVRPEIGYTFATGLRQLLRQDPDIIMVGEIRDGETAGLAINAALTGHIMLSTLHTNNSVGVIPRLADLGVPPFLLSSTLNLMLAQRLVRRVCPDCRVKVKVPRKAQEMIIKEFEGLPDQLRSTVEKTYKAPYSSFRGGAKPDCATCKGRGVLGRVALFEVFKMTRELGNLVDQGFTESSLWDEAHRQGIVTLRQDGIIKALGGEVLLEEVLRETT